MIYGDFILEQKRNELFKPSDKVMLEYFRNEIDILRSTLQYQNEISVCESAYELETLNENVISTIIEKIRELIEKFINWIKNIIKSIKDFFSKDSKPIEQKAAEAEKEIKDAETKQEIVKAASKTGAVTVTEDEKFEIKRLNSKSFLEFLAGNIARKYSEFEDFSRDFEKSEALLNKIDHNMNDDLNEDEYNKINEAIDMMETRMEKINELNSEFHINDFIKTYTYKSKDELKNAASIFIKDDMKALYKIKDIMNDLNRESNSIINEANKVKNEANKLTNTKNAQILNRMANMMVSTSNIIIGASVGFCSQGINKLRSQLKVSSSNK